MISLICVVLLNSLASAEKWGHRTGSGLDHKVWCLYPPEGPLSDQMGPAWSGLISHLKSFSCLGLVQILAWKKYSWSYNTLFPHGLVSDSNRIWGADWVRSGLNCYWSMYVFTSCIVWTLLLSNGLHFWSKCSDCLPAEYILNRRRELFTQYYVYNSGRTLFSLKVCALGQFVMIRVLWYNCDVLLPPVG